MGVQGSEGTAFFTKLLIYARSFNPVLVVSDISENCHFCSENLRARLPRYENCSTSSPTKEANALITLLH